MRKILLLAVVVLGMATAQAQKEVYIWIDITDKALIETNVNNAKEALQMLTNVHTMAPVNIAVFKGSHKLLGSEIGYVKVSRGNHGSKAVSMQNYKNSRAAAFKLLDMKNFDYESSQRTALYSSIANALSNGYPIDEAVIFSDLKENLVDKAKVAPLKFKSNTVVKGVVPDDVVQETINFWKKVAPGIKLSNRYRL